MANITKPVIKAMLICDKIITEVGTNKKSLIGIFENISAFNFPCEHYFLSVYIKLTDAKGRYNFCLKLVDLEEDTVIGTADIPKEIEISDPLTIHDLVFNLAKLKFKHPGKYEFRIYGNDMILAQKTFVVSKVVKDEKTP